MDPYVVLTGNPDLVPVVPRDPDPPGPYFLTVQEGVKVVYGEQTLPTCGVRIVHPSNVNAPSKALGVSVLYVPPGARMELHDHEAEETYCILSGTGSMLSKDGGRDVGPGDFVYLPAWCLHGILNTGKEMLTVLLALTPPNP